MSEFKIRDQIVITTLNFVIDRLETSIKMLNDIPREYKDVDLTDIALETYDVCEYAREVRDNLINSQK